MTLPQVATKWRKATRSFQTADCVEVGNTLTMVRDSKNPGRSITVNVPALLTAVKDGRIER